MYYFSYRLSRPFRFRGILVALQEYGDPFPIQKCFLMHVQHFFALFRLMKNLKERKYSEKILDGKQHRLRIFHISSIHAAHLF